MIKEAEESREPVVAGIKRDKEDPAGDPIIKVYSYNPPDYAIYRTRDRLIVQFADKKELALLQRKAISPLAPMRGQINGLINGWRHAGISSDGRAAEEPESESGDRLWWRKLSKSEQFQRACRYDRRVSDALITVLDEVALPGAATADGAATTMETAQTLLAQVKNDIIAERTSIARGEYVRWALGLVGLLVAAAVAMTLVVLAMRGSHIRVDPVWMAVMGGSVGGFFSIAIGLRGREVVIDLQNRENQLDVLLRMLIGAISGGVLYCLMASNLVSTKLIQPAQINPYVDDGAAYNDIVVFFIGFVAGLFERLVPELRNKTNFGTPEPAGQDTPLAKPKAAPDAKNEPESTPPAAPTPPPTPTPAPVATPVPAPPASPDLSSRAPPVDNPDG